MEMNHNAPGNISQKGVNSEADNETGFDSRAQGVAGRPDDGDEELGFDPESPDVSDPAVDPLHPARTSNDPDPSADDHEKTTSGPGAR
ncbi:DUF6021 family protein [Pseudomonas abietaniphila]|uniref:Uncharacterized protein n=1 Tax=Pseudomonas abietaniphila TaxID=89065 RepID=A0A1G7U7Y4_9PSED|nr:DUF6021 family protein [Pseudomonas abietaniphila]SDG43169.1 hypothetical protein SAMN05216605_10269 [Pseudomonas abietaniphila]